MVRKTAFQRRKYLILTGGALGLTILVVAGLELTDTTHLFHSKPTSATIPSSQSSSQANQSGNSDDSKSKSTTPSTSTESNKPNEKSTAPAAANNATVSEPYGTFVSNHSPSLSGTSAPKEVLSACSSTPGASCRITFTNAQTGSTRTLSTQTLDSNGSTTWDWDVKSANFSVGSWKIVATVTLGQQSKSTTDPLTLEVKP